jgi:ectoine hydroxylase-related dioxygenase (phytanoyl-CoA dioxygenase family)
MNLSHNKLFYEENGYLVLENVLSRDECKYIKDLLEQHTTDDYTNMLNPDRYDFLVAQSTHRITGSMRDRIDYLEKCQYTSVRIRELLRDRRVVGELEHLYEKKFYGLSTHMIWKKPDTKFSEQAWRPHQDNNENKPGNEVEVPSKYKKNDVLGNTGDMYIQHGNLIHGSYPNKSKGMRGMYSSTYIVKGEEFESGYNAMRKEIGL